MAPRKPKTRKQKPRKSKPRKRTLKKMSQSKYKSLILKRQHHKKLSHEERKQLDRELLKKYCSCVKKLKYNESLPKNIKYPVCLNSIYKKRGFKSPKGVSRRCYKSK